MNWLKKLWDWIKGGVRTLLMAVCEAVVARAKAVAEDKELVNLCLTAIQAAITEGLTGEKAWAYARDQLVQALKRSGRVLGDCAIDTALQCVYDAWKNGAIKKAS